jgi:hypothetical protein
MPEDNPARKSFEAVVKTAREAVDRGTAAAEQATRPAEHYGSTTPAHGPSRPSFEAPSSVLPARKFSRALASLEIVARSTLRLLAMVLWLLPSANRWSMDCGNRAK